MEENLSNIENQLLVMDAQDGDAGAMEKLVKMWQKRLWRHAFRLTGEREAAWDITQQTWLGIIKGLRKLEDAANFRAWVYRITTNKSIDWIRKNRRLRQINVEEIEDHQKQEGNDMGVKELLQKLDVRKRTVLSLYYFEQLSVSEISTALNIPKGTVKSRLVSARKELKELWQKHFE
jgi:RNA polymerase sigma-70 factor (ECF subfamily)